MRRNIFLLLFFMLLTAYTAHAVDHMYEINLKYSYGNLSYDSIHVRPLAASDQPANTIGGYAADILSFNNEILNVTFFDIPREIYYDSIDEETGEINDGGIITLDESEILLQLPYFDNAQKIRIFDENIDIQLVIDVSQYAKEIIEEVEVIQEKPETEQNAAPEAKPEQKKINYINFLIMALTAIILLFIIFLVIKRKQKKNLY